MALPTEDYPSFNVKQKKSNNLTENIKEKRTFKLKNLVSLKGLILIVFIIQLILLGLLLTVSAEPINNLIQKYQYNQIVSKVIDLTKVNSQQTQVVAIVADVEKLKSANSIQAEVYKDAMNGDYIVGVGASNDTIIIYRKNENKVIYQGDSPQAKLVKIQSDAVSQINTKAKDKKLLDQSSIENPSLTQVVNPADYISTNKDFYKNVQKDDIIAYYSKAQVVMIYRISTSAIINSGKIN